MGLFDKLLNSNNNSSNETIYTIPTSSLVKSTDGTSDSVGSSGSTSYATIDEDDAMKIPAVNQGVATIADTCASLPLYLYKETDGYQEIFYDDPRSKVMTDMANNCLSAFALKRELVKDLILHGNCYAKIVREGDRVNLIYLPVNIVTPKKDGDGYYFEVQSYSTDVSGERYPAEIVDEYDMLVVTKNAKYNTVVGTGLLDYANNIFATAIEETTYMYNLLVNGLSSKAILNTKTPFKREVKEKLKNDLREFYSGSNNAGKIMLLEGDINVLPLAMTPTDIKLIENQHFTISQIARFLNIPKHLLNLDRTSGTYSNITQERLQLLQTSLIPYVSLIESAMNQKLLEDAEKEAGYYFKFDVSEIMKMTPTEQSEYVLSLFEANVLTIEEVRLQLGLGADSETINQLKQIQAAKTAAAISIDENIEVDDTPKDENNQSVEETDEDIDKKS